VAPPIQRLPIRRPKGGRVWVWRGSSRCHCTTGAHKGHQRPARCPAAADAVQPDRPAFPRHQRIDSWNRGAVWGPVSGWSQGAS
jgi:hypothetical protein